jgi:hypothetical protein
LMLPLELDQPNNVPRPSSPSSVPSKKHFLR